MSIIKLSSDVLTTAAAGQIEYDGKVFYGTPQSTQRGVIPGEQYFRLDAALAGANVNTAQNTFGVGVSLSASTVYEFEAVFALSKTAGTTSHTTTPSFGGTATLNNISFVQYTSPSTVGSTDRVATNAVFPSSAAGVAVAGATTSATYFVTVVQKGTVSINAAGSFIPQYTLSAAPGGAYSTVAGSYFKIYPIGTSGANISVGTWA